MCHSCDSELKERLTLRHYVLFIQSNFPYVTIKRRVSGRSRKVVIHVSLPLRRPDSSTSWQIIHRVKFQFYDMRSSMLSLNVLRVI